MKCRARSSTAKRRMALVQVADLRLDAECGQQPPPADSQDDLLHQAQLRPAAVQLTGDPSVRGDVCGIVAVQQVELARPTWTCQVRSQTDDPGSSSSSRNHSPFGSRSGVIGNWPGSL